MSNVTVAVIGPEGYAGSLGKKGTSSDITFYNLKKGEHTVTWIEPTRYPERVSSLFLAISLAKQVIVVVDEINAAFGETVVMLDCARKEKGFLVLRNYITPDQILPLIKGTAVSGYQIVRDDLAALRENMISEAEHLPEPGTVKKNPGSVPIDHFFHVQGIGPVALGEVVGGTINRHDLLRVWPTKKNAQVRSIQKHDADAESAVSGDRVGLALKGVGVEDLDRGYVLSADPEISSSATISGKASLTKFWSSPLKEGMVLHIGHWMQFLTARTMYVDNSGDWRRPSLTLRADNELVYSPGQTAILHQLDSGKLRVAGTITLE